MLIRKILHVEKLPFVEKQEDMNNNFGKRAYQLFRVRLSEFIEHAA